MAVLRDQRHLLPLPGQPISLGSAVMLMSAVEGLAVLGMKEEAARFYPQFHDLVGRGIVLAHGSGLVQRVAGIAAASGGNWDGAEAHFEAALREAHELPHKIEQPEVRRWYADMLIERGAPDDVEKARGLLGEAIEMYRTIGMPRHIELADGALARA